MTLHKATGMKPSKETDKERGQRTASCTSASLPRVQESRGQRKTGAEGRSVGPKGRESRSRYHVVKTAELDRREVIRSFAESISA